MSSGKIAGAAGNSYGKSLCLGLAGAAIGIVWVVILAVVLGMWPLFIAFPPFAIHLVLSALVGAAATAMVARLLTRKLPTLAIVATAAVLTFLLFAALPAYFLLQGSGRPGGLLFN